MRRTQDESGGMLMLMTRNPFPMAIKFKMIIWRTDLTQSAATSSCAVRAGIMSVESWQEPIAMVQLDDGHVPADDALGRCE